jgi:hypothetical protein
MLNEPLLLPSGSVPAKTPELLLSSALSPYLVLVVVSDVAFRGMLHSREWLVVLFGNPFTEIVPDRVEVPLATHCAGVKPQHGLRFQLLNLFRAQTAEALFWFHMQIGNDCGTLVGCSFRNQCRLPFSNGKYLAPVRAPEHAWANASHRNRPL